MTVCIAAKANDNKSLVLAADQMATMSHLVREQEGSHKVLKIVDGIYLLTAGDAVAAKTIYKEILDNAGNISTVEDAVNFAKQAYVNTHLTYAQSVVLVPRGLTFDTYNASQRSMDVNVVSLIDQSLSQFKLDVLLIVAGINPDGEAKIYEVDPPGISGEFDIFCTTGSGSSHATNSLYARNYSASLTPEEALYLVFEAKTRSEVAPGVGSKTDLYLVSKGKLKVYSDDELKEYKNLYEKVMEEEQELLKKKLVEHNNGNGNKAKVDKK